MVNFLDLLLGKSSKFFLLLLFLFLSFFAYQAKELQLDASSDTLILEDDQDLKKAREVSKIYASKDFLIITLTDNKGIISDENIWRFSSLHFHFQMIFGYNLEMVCCISKN